MQKTGKLIFSFTLIALLVIEGVSATPYYKAMGTPANYYKAMGTPAKDSASNKKPHGKKKPEQQLILQPIVRLGVGVLSYVGNVKANAATTYFQSPSSGRIGYDLGLTQKLSPVAEFSLTFLYGNVAETQYTPPAYWNFQSTLTGGGINLLFKILPKQQVTPYVIIGVESYEFLSRADVYDQYGNEYYSWTDGTLRSTPQNAANAANAKILNLNYDYSTDIRSLNVGGAGSYNQQTFAVPVGVGFMFRVGTRADFMIGTTLHYTFTDHIDGLTPQVQGPLKGSLNNDMFLFSYASLRFNLTRDHPKVRHNYSKNNTYVDIKDTVHPYQPGKFDTSLTAIQMQHEREYDTTGKYAKQTVDPFEWRTSKPGYVTNYTNVKPSQPAPGLKTNPANPAPANPTPAPETPPNNSNANNGGAVYRIQLLATQVPLAEGITFAGINGKADVEVVNGMYRYTTGNFSNSADAQKYLKELKSKGYNDAFIRIDNTNKGGAPAPAAPKNVTPQPSAPATPAVKPGTSNAAAAIGAGLVYKIQIGVYGATPPDQHFMSALSQFSDLKIVKDNAGLNHYLVGSYSDFKSATAARDQAKQGGMKDACVMAFNNGHYISNAQAQGMEKK